MGHGQKRVTSINFYQSSQGGAKLKNALDLSMTSGGKLDANSTVGGKTQASLNNSAIVLGDSFQSTSGPNGAKIFVPSKP